MSFDIEQEYHVHSAGISAMLATEDALFSGGHDATVVQVPWGRLDLATRMYGHTARVTAIATDEVGNLVTGDAGGELIAWFDGVCAARAATNGLVLSISIGTNAVFAVIKRPESTEICEFTLPGLILTATAPLTCTAAAAVPGIVGTTVAMHANADSVLLFSGRNLCSSAPLPSRYVPASLALAADSITAAVIADNDLITVDLRTQAVTTRPLGARASAVAVGGGLLAVTCGEVLSLFRSEGLTHITSLELVPAAASLACANGRVCVGTGDGRLLVIGQGAKSGAAQTLSTNSAGDMLRKSVDTAERLAAETRELVETVGTISKRISGLEVSLTHMESRVQALGSPPLPPAVAAAAAAAADSESAPTLCTDDEFAPSAAQHMYTQSVISAA